MQFKETLIKDAYLITSDRHEDERGFFGREFCQKEFTAHGLPPYFVQISLSLNNHKHTFRGMHYQLPPYAETKMVRCISGKLLDIIVDLRPESATYKQWVSEELSAENHRMLCIPKGCAHGFLTLTDNTQLIYYMDAFHSPTHERGVRWNDPEFNITLPFSPAIIADKDQSWKDFDPAYHLTTG